MNLGRRACSGGTGMVGGRSRVTGRGRDRFVVWLPLSRIWRIVGSRGLRVRVLELGCLGWGGGEGGGYASGRDVVLTRELCGLAREDAGWWCAPEGVPNRVFVLRGHPGLVGRNERQTMVSG